LAVEFFFVIGEKTQRRRLSTASSPTTSLSKPVEESIAAVRRQRSSIAPSAEILLPVMAVEFVLLFMPLRRRSTPSCGGIRLDGSPDEISVSEGSLIDITYSDIQGGDPDNPGSPYPGIGNIDPCDPAFAGNGDYHLTDSSCCIDTGTDVGAPDYDIDGDIRPCGDGYDMGADEFQPVYAPGKHGKP